MAQENGHLACVLLVHHSRLNSRLMVFCPELLSGMRFLPRVSTVAKSRKATVSRHQLDDTDQTWLAAQTSGVCRTSELPQQSRASILSAIGPLEESGFQARREHPVSCQMLHHIRIHPRLPPRPTHPQARGLICSGTATTVAKETGLQATRS